MSSLSKNLTAQTKFNGQPMSVVSAINAIAALDEETYLTTSEAAIFLRRSVSQLERMRVDGTGPKYFQSKPKPGSKATNLTVLYKKAALRDYLENNTAADAMAHAVRNARTFSTLRDLADPCAFYVDLAGNVESLVDDNLLGIVIKRLGSDDITWLPPLEAASGRWTSLDAHRKFAERVDATLRGARSGVAAGLSATEIAEEIDGI